MRDEFDLVGSIIRGPDGVLYCEIDGERQTLSEFVTESANADSADDDAQAVYFNVDGGIEVPVDDNGLPLQAPALWKDRTTGREVTPVDFIRKYYAPWLGGDGGEPVMTRADLNRLDLTLYNAYVARIRRHPSEDLGLAVKEQSAVADPNETLEKQRKRSRDYYHRKRQKTAPVELSFTR